MRLAFAAGALCFSLAGLASQTVPPVPPDAATAASGVGNDDAVKHARRTACLKDAKSKKLLGAERTAFLKDCIAAPSGVGT